MKEKDIDYVLVPLGLAAMIIYHAWLLHRITARPTRTVIGINAISRRIWVQAMMEDSAKNGVLAVQTLRNNIMASTLLASTAIMLSSVIAVLMTGNSGVLGGAHSSPSPFVYGDGSEVGISIKLFAILLCFLLAFLLNVQSIRYYSHSSVLINVPPRGSSTARMLAADYVCRTINRGGYFWSLGLRACYFSFPLFLWVFGPIPMAASSFLLVFLLYFLDSYSDWSDAAAVELSTKGGDLEGGAAVVADGIC